MFPRYLGLLNFASILEKRGSFLSGSQTGSSRSSGRVTPAAVCNDRFFRLPERGTRQDEIASQRRDDEAGHGQDKNVSAPAGQGGRTRADRRRLRRDVDSVRTDIEGPRQNKRDWKSGENKNYNQPCRPRRQGQDRQDRRGNLNDKPAHHPIGCRDAVDFASPQFAKKSIET